MRPLSEEVVLAGKYVALGLLVGLAIYVADGSLVAAAIFGIGTAVVGATIADDRRLHRDPDAEPEPSMLRELLEVFWPPAIAASLAEKRGWRRLGVAVLGSLVPVFILVPFALEAAAAGATVRAWLGAALVILIAVRLAALILALPLLRARDEAPPGA